MKIKIDIDRETLFGGIFGVIAIIAAITEMFLNGADKIALVAAIKDVFGTLVAVVLLFSVLKDRLPKIYKDFDKAFNAKMEKLVKKYSPVLSKDEKVDFRYNIDSNLSSICGEKHGTPRRFFDYTEETIVFYVKKEIFMGRTTDSFDEMQKRIISQITTKLNSNFSEKCECEIMDDGFKVNVEKQDTAEKQAELMSEIADNVLLLYIAENKK